MADITLNLNKLNGYGLVVAELIEGIGKGDEAQIKLATKHITSIANDHEKYRSAAMKLHLKAVDKAKPKKKK